MTNRTTRRPRLKKTALGMLGSGNVFADLGLPNPEILLSKVKLVGKISSIIEQRGLTSGRTAQMMGMSQQELADILHGHTRPHTIDDLKEWLQRLSPEAM